METEAQQRLMDKTAFAEKIRKDGARTAHTISCQCAAIAVAVVALSDDKNFRIWQVSSLSCQATSASPDDKESSQMARELPQMTT